MYIVSENRLPVPATELKRFQSKHNIKLPMSYCRFLSEYGQGTYRGVMNIVQPDVQILVPFAEHELWDHEGDSPLTQSQIAECVAIGTSIDGDFIAVHRNVEGLLWLPRHGTDISVKQVDKASWAEVLDGILEEEYTANNSETGYFEPWNNERKHVFLKFNEYGKSMKELARLFREEFEMDFQFENEYTCQLFLARLHGYVRFNYAYNTEIAVIYEPAGAELYGQVIRFLERHQCMILK
ncbi:SMI1/KNR4 family protein [Paenibacillus nasutitermitis]|uniref:Knr4/Smi1-like domain-containing protein n=1 Tax=Paenibacillus nasutitermitis TaxID=1652958 RepID=A0A916YND3_9BACL|nr:SMI1/KNR4 family protein [Paenibacillus nasutitermitis]GGD53601.1 hypothetical protein GCM10010911_08940 [Paenibacillus nasutitermitis]